MIVPFGTGKHFVYRHVREDIDKVFYVGCGTVPPKEKVYGHNTYYSRAFLKSKTRRNALWMNVISKSSYRVEILLETNSESFAFEKEKEFISIYNRDGYLANIDNGGKIARGEKHNKINRLVIGTPINQIDLKTNETIRTWLHLLYIEEELGFLKTNIVKCCRKKQITAYGYKWSYALNNSFDNTPATAHRKGKLTRQQADQLRRINSKFNRPTTVYKFDRFLNHVSTYTSVSQSAFSINCNPIAVYKILDSGNLYHGYYWCTENKAPNPSKELYEYIQYSLNGDYIKSFNSLSEITSFLGIKSHTSIRESIHNGTRAYGYKWVKKTINIKT